MTIKQQVTNILRASQKARDDHKELLVIYMQKSGMNLSPEQIATFRQMPDLWTVRRTCQKMQEQGEFPASPEVDKKRFENFKHVRENIARSDSDGVERIVAGDKEYIIKPFGEY